LGAAPAGDRKERLQTGRTAFLSAGDHHDPYGMPLLPETSSTCSAEAKRLARVTDAGAESLDLPTPCPGRAAQTDHDGERPRSPRPVAPRSHGSLGGSFSGIEHRAIATR
jgi:hypothetical protein